MTKQKSLPELSLDSKGHERVVLAWTASEYIQHKKSARWYLGAAIFLLLMLVWGIYGGNWSMILALLVFGAVYEYLHAHHPPKQIKIKISELGVSAGEMFYPFSHIQAFWIIYQHGLKTLNLRVSKHFFSDIIIQLEEEDPVKVRQYLVGQIPEWEGKEEKLSDQILRLLKL